MSTDIKPKIAIIDYGMGNIRSVMNALEEIGASGELVHDPDLVANYDKVILPGVGAFKEAIEHLKSSAMDQALHAFVGTGRDLLGICLGMQLICQNSNEDGEHEGLGWVDARVRAFSPDRGLKVPHMGWNSINFTKDSPIFEGLETGLDAYFVHGYRVEAETHDATLATTEYGEDFICIVQNENVYGMQFHPEKSQATGLKLLQNFCINI